MKLSTSICLHFQLVERAMGTKNDITKTFVRPAAGNQRDHAVKDLSKLSKPQLLEMRDRQRDILKNK